MAHPVLDQSIPYVEGEEAFHDMTNQKAYAKDKWSSIEISVQNINAILSILGETDFAEEEYYREVLNTWKEGNFSDFVEVHN